MDGIFGVGVPEMILIILVLFVVGGPTNSAKWARDFGRMVRKAREAWADMIAEVEKEIGPEGQEIMGVARELGQGAREIARMDPARQLVNETLQMVEQSVDLEETATTKQAGDPGVAEQGAGETPDAESDTPRYPAWMPPGDVEK